MTAAKIAQSLLEMEPETKAFVMAQALEVYDRTSHYEREAGAHSPALEETDALRDLIKRVSRAAVAVAFSRLANSSGVKMHEPVLEFLTELAVELDIQAVEIEDGA
jgi:hypothetical protein